MKFVFSVLFFLLTFLVVSQETPAKKSKQSLIKSQEQKDKDKARKAPITSYRIINIERDTTYADTSLTIKDQYEYNYLRKDIFGLMPFANEGQTYNTLQYNLNPVSTLPSIGYSAKQFDYIQANQVNYYSVATPFTELYFKTVIAQGQSADSFVTINTSESFNFSLNYRGEKSEGRYINQATSTASFRFTASYKTKDKRYSANAHYAGQNLGNEENGGITNPEDFISKDPAFSNRITLQVFLTDATSTFKGNRYFIDQNFRINKTETQNNLYLTAQTIFEKQFFEYNQNTLTSTIGKETFNRFGPSYVFSNANDKTKYNKWYNKLGAVYENKTLGKFQFFIDDFRSNYYYNSIFVSKDKVIPSSLNDVINAVGGQYEYKKEKWNGKFLFSTSISNQAMTNLDAFLNYKYDDRNQISFQYQNISKVPDNIYDLHQSNYLEYNWYNDFKNEKNNNININATTQWANAYFQASTLNDHLYFSDDNDSYDIQIVTPKQYSKTIKYLSLKLSKEITYRKFALDNTFLFQQVDQPDPILNVPSFVTRNSLYYSERFFKRALYIQTGIIFNYFSNFYSDTHNPLIGEFFVQNETKIGNYATFDFFVNARIRQTRIFLMAEHFNSSFAPTSTYFSAPNNPYRDFVIRFGLVWNFFQ